MQVSYQTKGVYRIELTPDEASAVIAGDCDALSAALRVEVDAHTGTSVGSPGTLVEVPGVGKVAGEIAAGGD